LNDKRFKLVTDAKEAQILWLISAIKDEDNALVSYGVKESDVYFNYFKAEAALVSKDNISQLINSTLADKSCMMQTFDLGW